MLSLYSALISRMPVELSKVVVKDLVLNEVVINELKSI